MCVLMERPEEGVGSCRAGVRGGCQLVVNGGCWEQKWGLLQEQQALLTIESSLAPYVIS